MSNMWSVKNKFPKSFLNSQTLTTMFIIRPENKISISTVYKKIDLF